MFKKIIMALFLAIPFTSVAQNYNPFVAQGIVSPAPLGNVASNGTGKASFLVGNTGDDALPLVANQEMLLVITLSRGIPNNANPIAAVGGTMASYFDWMYDPMTFSYLGTQNQLIPDALNGGVGSIEIAYKVTSNSLETSPQNGFNVNITPPAYTNGINSLNDDQVSSYTWTEALLLVNPDVNTAWLNAQVSGSVNTNDNFPAGTTYDGIVSSGVNPSSVMPVLNTDGTYTFTSSVVGVYNFVVSAKACPTCPIITSMLTITVLDSALNTNAPVATTDLGGTSKNTSVTIKSLSNDNSSNTGVGAGLNPASVTISTAPKNGTTMVDPLTGDITYTPNSNFTGKDTLYYQVCDSQIVPKCAIAMQIVETIDTTISPNTTLATDDFSIADYNTPISGNAKVNDIDIENDKQKVTEQTTVISGKGTLVLDSTGNYTFTPVSGFTGTVEYPYTTTDTKGAESNATIYIVVRKASNFSLPIVLKSFTGNVKDCNTELIWVTSNEINTDYFNVQRKSANSTQFVTIGIVEASVNSNLEKTYSFRDVAPTFGNYQYQLETVDLDGKKSISQIVGIKIDCSNTNSIEVYPNPTTDFINVVINNTTNEDYEFTLYNLAGQVVYTSTLNVNKTMQKVSIPIKSLAKGQYNLKVKGNIEVNSYKILKNDE